MSNDRAAVAREVLTELLEFAYARAETVSDTRQFMRERYPAPPAPETVTVGDDVYSRRGDTWYVGGFNIGLTLRHRELLDRIASDARVIRELERSHDAWEADARREAGNVLYWRGERDRAIEAIKERDARIAELETQLQRALDGAVFHEKRAHHAEQERDAALRALREYQNGIGPMGSKGEGCGEVGVSTAAHGGSGATQPDQGESPVAAPSPAPIPLGADEKPFDQTMDAKLWAQEFVRRFPAHDEGLMLAWFANAIMRGYDTARAKYEHPVATRETVERILRKQAWSSVPFTHRAEEILTAAGITLEEGA